MSSPLKIFCCYAREDQAMLEQLQKHLVPLERQGLITIWSDMNLNAGVEWERELHQRLEHADIILLMISPDFMNSDYCYSTEMDRAIQRHDQGSARVIPVLLRSTLWQGAPFAKLQMVPTNAEPVKNWSDQDKAFHNITEWISQLITGRQTQPDKPSSYPTSLQQSSPVVAQSSEKVDPELSLQALPAPSRRPKGILVILLSAILIPALAVGSSFIEGTPLWELFHTASVALPDVSWSTPRAITCDDLFNPFQPPQPASVANCTPTSDSHVTLSFNKKLQDKYPELDVNDGRGPSAPTYRIELRMDLSPTNGVPHIAGCIVMDTSKNSDAGEVVCIHNNGLIEVLDAATMSSESVTKHLEDKNVTISDPANVSVIAERVNNQLFIEVANQVIDPVTPPAAAANIGFLAVGDQGSVKMTAIELT